MVQFEEHPLNSFESVSSNFSEEAKTMRRIGVAG